MPEPTDRAKEASPPASTERLDSWKEIAAYLRRDVSTVQRWEKREALPVHRHLHNRLATIYAYPPEIDAWWNNRRPRLEQEEEKRRARVGRRRLVAGGLGLGTLLLLAGLALLRTGALERRPTTAASSSITLRRQTEPEGALFLGRPSPDGRLLPYATGDTGDLALFDLKTSRSQRLTQKGSWESSTDYASAASVSPEGGEVAFAWYNQEGEFVDLRLAGAEGSEPRVLFRDPEIDAIELAEWSHDGRVFLALFKRKEGRDQLVLIRPGEGAVDVLRTFDATAPQGMSLSPDGRYVAYDLPVGGPHGERDVFLTAVGGSETVLVRDAKDDLWPVWTPDGDRVVFASDRTGGLSLWSQRVEEDKPRGPPEPIYKDLGRARPLGMTRDGSYYYQLQTGMVNVQVATLDPATGALVGEPSPAAIEFVGSNLSPDWSPDGRLLAYTSHRGHVEGEKGSVSLVVRSLESHEEGVVVPELAFLIRPRWSPDGRRIAVKGHGPRIAWGFHDIDPATGAVIGTLLAGNFADAVRSPDGRMLFYNTSDRIVRKDLEKGREEDVYRVTAPSAVGLIGLSPDGKWLAVTRARKGGMHSLSVMPSGGGPVREILSEQERAFSSLCWTADGRALLFVPHGNGERRLYRIDIEGREPRPLGLAREGLRDVRAHPDGRRIAFTSGWPSFELWVMEHFLPAEREIAAAGR